MDLNIKSSLTWVNLFLETNNAGYVCRRCGISRPTLRKWVNRYNKLGIDSLADQSKRPKNSPKIKLTTEIENRILDLRKKRNLGVRQ